METVESIHTFEEPATSINVHERVAAVLKIHLVFLLAENTFTIGSRTRSPGKHCPDVTYVSLGHLPFSASLLVEKNQCTKKY